MIELYYRRHCPYSAKVRNYIEENGLKSQIYYREIDEDESEQEQLLEMTGALDVPVLAIEGEPLPKNDDIIQWIENNLESPRLHFYKKDSEPRAPF